MYVLCQDLGNLLPLMQNCEIVNIKQIVGGKISLQMCEIDP